ncbi:type II toxin-antitoxin system tRNA(fMet)-specific endonuclease VapC [Endothiovibrio diazotrophicus]
MRYLLDTNICIYLIKRRPASVLEHFTSTKVGDIAISSVTVYELAYGAGKSNSVEKSRAALSHFLAPLSILPFDEEDAIEAGLIRAHLTRSGRTIGPYDLQIAGQARRRNLTLVSNNLREFERVDGLLVENWV